MRKYLPLLSLAFITFSCCLAPTAPFKTVRQIDLDSWNDVPVSALDLHSFWNTIPMVKTITDQDIEIRMYVNKKNISSCYGSGNANVYLSTAAFNEFKNCVTSSFGCDNIFYIKNDKVLEYVPVGNCYTDDSLRPEKRYKSLLNN